MEDTGMQNLTRAKRVIYHNINNSKDRAKIEQALSNVGVGATGKFDSWVIKQIKNQTSDSKMYFASRLSWADKGKSPESCASIDDVVNVINENYGIARRI